MRWKDSLTGSRVSSANEANRADQCLDELSALAKSQPEGLTRREFLQSAGGAAGGAVLLNGLALPGDAEASGTSGTPSGQAGTSAINLPRGGGAVRGIGETFQPDLFTGTGNLSVPIAATPGRGDFGPQLSLQYSTGNGNGPFGLGWQLSVPRVSRKTEKGVPQYEDADVFILSGSEDLVPVLDPVTRQPKVDHQGSFTIVRYRPRTEGLFARIERWTDDDKDTHWRVTTKDNVTSYYGRTMRARTCDPNDPRRVFEWLLEETFDAKGNHILYEYVQDPNADDSDLPNERLSQRYLRRILYGNLPESLPSDSEKRVGPERALSDPLDPGSTHTRQYLFELLFDYGDVPKHPGRADLPSGAVDQVTAEWPVRQDGFFSCRAGFEVRTRLLCRRILMLHHFSEGELKQAPLVKSTDFSYTNDPSTRLSLLESITVVGYRKVTGVDSPTYRTASLPPLTFEYSRFQPNEQRFQTLKSTGANRPPGSLKDPSVAVAALYGDGLPGILESTPGAPTYWQNLGEGVFTRRELQNHPVDVSLGDPGVTLGDLVGDGLPDLIVFRGAASGFYEATGDGGWGPWRPFRSCPPFLLEDPNVRLVDLTGDGRPDMLRTDDRHTVFLPSLGEDGYGDEPVYVRRMGLDKFPNVYFSDSRVRIADMNGDGLPDIVVVTSAGLIEYWPNHGHGDFGQRVTMKRCPRFGPGFDPTRLFLTDLDGTGCADLVYVGDGSVDFWFNQCGQAWSDQGTIHGTPRVHNATGLQFADLLGTGTAALIWSWDAGSGPDNRFRMLDFCGGKKPFLLTKMNNNMGTTTRVRYGSSAQHATRDRKEGRPWLTPLPFPVNVVDEVEVIDHVSRTKLVTTYRYHHGYYAGRNGDREFRGFACVEQQDCQEFDTFRRSGPSGTDAEFDNKEKWKHVPPVRTVTWFHTGLYFDGFPVPGSSRQLDHRDLTSALRREFYREGRGSRNKEDRALALGDHLVDRGATPHEAFRALRGSILRTEVYGEDGTSEAKHPYTVSENRYRAILLQAGSGDRAPPVYLPVKLESLTHHYERNPDDPRIAHRLSLEFDPYGNVLESLSLAYPRRQEFVAHPEQRKLLATYTINRYINQEHDREAHFIGVGCESLVHEVHNLDRGWPANGKAQPLSAENDVVRSIRGRQGALPFAARPASGQTAKRLIGWSRTYFRDDVEPENMDPIGNTDHRLQLGQISALGLPYETYTAAVSADLRSEVYQSEQLDGFEVTRDGGYHFEDGTPGLWWIPSGRQSFHPELFYQPTASQDAFGNRTAAELDCYGLLLTKSTDPVGNSAHAENDYRVLQPCVVTDPNGASSQVAFDALGMVVATAVSGKHGEGDTLGGPFPADLSRDEIRQHFDDPFARAPELLQGASTRIVYDLHRFEDKGEPVGISTLSRERHVSYSGSQLAPVDEILQSVLYSDGFGREVQTKTLADYPRLGSPPRWVASGTVVLNSKGKAVQSYEPFFSQDHRFGLEQHGATATLFYDPLERVVCALAPGMRDSVNRQCHTYEKTVFDPWQQRTWDANDTVLSNPADDPHVGRYLRPYIDSLGAGFATWFDLRVDSAELGADGQCDDDSSVLFGYLTPTARTNPEQRAALLTSVHAGTFAEAHLDTLGRVFLTVQQNAMKRCHESEVSRERFETRSELDITGNSLAIEDPRGVATIHDFDLAGRALRIRSPDAGVKTTLPDAVEAPIRAWDGEGRKVTTFYDALRRPTEVHVSEDGITFLAERTVYGDESGSPAEGYLKGRAYRMYDGAGRLTSSYDFKGNVASAVRDVASSYKGAIDWAADADPLQGAEAYTTETQYDALNRTSLLLDPGANRHVFTYNARSLLYAVRLERALNGGQLEEKRFIDRITYDAKGQRQIVSYANGVRTEFTYDPDTHRLKRILTTRPAAADPLQDLRYTYDPVGNVTQIEDAAFPTVFNHNQRIDPISGYTYDAAYRLVEATGREHESLGTAEYGSTLLGRHPGFIKLSRQPIQNGQALRNFTERFVYDPSGNLTEIRHISGGAGGWTRVQAYEDGSNRLATSKGGSESEFDFTHDKNGNIRRMPHLHELSWDYAGNLREAGLSTQTDGQTYDRAFWCYDSGGSASAR